MAIFFIIAAIAKAVAVGGVATLTTKFATGVLGLIGFTNGGVAAGSIAAAIQAAIGNVAAGSIFAGLQSLAALGGFAVTGPVGVVAAALAGIALSGCV